jgi:hypothetical protein
MELSGNCGREIAAATGVGGCEATDSIDCDDGTIGFFLFMCDLATTVYIVILWMSIRKSTITK